MKIVFTIPDEKIQRAIDAMKGLCPIPQIKDPNNPDQFIPEFTDNQWAKEAVRRLVVRDVMWWETKIAHEAATPPADDEIIS